MIFGKSFCRLTKETLFRGEMEINKDQKVLKRLIMIVNRKTLITKSIFFQWESQNLGRSFSIETQRKSNFYE